MFKFAVKAGLAYIAIYYIKEEGIWKESKESLKALDKMSTCSYLTTVKQQIPFEMPELPDGRVNEIMKQYWNCGVLTTFKFLSELPTHANNWTNKGLDFIKQPELASNLTKQQTNKNEEKAKEKK